MVNRPSQPEIITVNSEELQSQIRDLLPSQNGFGSELQASNVITPIIDLTQAAQGSQLPLDLSTAIAFGSQTSFNITNGSSALVSSPGFYRLFGTCTIDGNFVCSIGATDGLSGVDLLQLTAGTGGNTVNWSFDFNVWAKPGVTFNGSSNNAAAVLNVTVRQIADSEGNIVNPSGFPI